MKKIFYILIHVNGLLNRIFASNEGKIRMETRGRVIGIDIGTTSTKTVVFTEKRKSHCITCNRLPNYSTECRMG